MLYRRQSSARGEACEHKQSLDTRRYYSLRIDESVRKLDFYFMLAVARRQSHHQCDPHSELKKGKQVRRCVGQVVNTLAVSLSSANSSASGEHRTTNTASCLCESRMSLALSPSLKMLFSITYCLPMSRRCCDYSRTDNCYIMIDVCFTDYCALITVINRSKPSPHVNCAWSRKSSLEPSAEPNCLTDRRYCHLSIVCNQNDLLAIWEIT